MESVKITYRESDYSRSCYLTGEQIKRYGLSNMPGSMLITIGSLSLELNKVIVNDNMVGPNELCFSKDIKHRITVPENTILQIRRTGIDCLEIGPLIGVFVSSRKIADLADGKKNDGVYKQFTALCKSLCGLCCFFSIGDIDWENKLIKGLLWDDSQWVSTILPLPTVIYDRCFGRYGRKNGMILRERLGCGYNVINAVPKLGKWETIKALTKNQKLIDLIPQTSLYHFKDDLEEAMKQFPSVYLKPDLLSKGKGVFRVSIGPGTTYVVEYRTKEENEVVYLPTLSDLDELLNKYIATGGGYIIQQEIDKASYKSYPFDFRVLYQKDWRGNWQSSGIAVRMGAPGSIITSPRSGGAVENISTVIQEVFGQEPTTEGGLYQEIIDIGREVALTIDEEFGDCVELGLDMTIDVNRKIWIIEVNGKPLKVSLKRLDDPKLINRCYNRPIEYAIFLTGFQAMDSEELGGFLS